MTEWIQAIIALAALLVAFWASRVSKSAAEISKMQLELSKSQYELSEVTLELNKSQYEVSKATVELSKQISYASHRCILYPERVSSVNGGYWSITFRNNGVGVAFNIKVLMYIRARLDQTSKPVPIETNGSKVINPQAEQSYITMEGDHSLHILQETPIVIQWEELSGVKNEAHWFWSATSIGDEMFSLKQHIKLKDNS